MRPLLVLSAVVLLACGDSATPSEEGSAGANSSTGSQSGSGQTPTGAATSVATSAATSTSTSGNDTTSAADSGTTGAPPSPTCVEDLDCTLIDNCVNCAATLASSNDDRDGGTPPAFFDLGGGGCEQTQCELWDNPTPECRFDRCALSKLHCGPVTCDAIPPECDPPFVPLVDPDAECWSGNCGPASACEYVDSCVTCEAADQLCVQLEGETRPTCEQAPPDCDGSSECECAGAVFCGAAACSVSDTMIVCGE